jgi:hypothetical protein
MSSKNKRKNRRFNPKKLNEIDRYLKIIFQKIKAIASFYWKVKVCETGCIYWIISSKCLQYFVVDKIEKTKKEKLLCQNIIK